jgi:hypothetical protein
LPLSVGSSLTLGRNSMRQWSFVADMNSEGIITVSDVWLWVKWLFFYPGDLLLQVIVNYAPALATFLELAPSSFGGWGSGTISFFAWLVLLLAIGIAENYAPRRSRPDSP